ncbi:integrase family protein [Sulfobacillus acidophilus TPY]|nr:integrase family protein [Sulfobacillus acidophilus TPY]
MSTRNVRLAALYAFVQYLQREQPEFMMQAQQLRAIPLKKTASGPMPYLTVEQMKFLLSLPNLAVPGGRRDAVLLSLLYDTGARVQELCDVVAGDIKEGPVSTMRLTGKGQKSRIVPLMPPMGRLLEQYRQERKLTHPQASAYPLFQNRAGSKLSREGVAYIVTKYVQQAARVSPGTLPDTVSPHGFRHSKAMHLLQAGVNLVYIRDLLGHVDLKTTEMYARVDSEMKRKALERHSGGIVSETLPPWQANTELLTWLKGLGSS